jgi:very-short-patch-repair endonuclease
MQQTDLSKARARDLRGQVTAEEARLWDLLRGRRVLGLKIRRKVPLGPYVADFYCADHRLVIEAPGNRPADPDRMRWLSRRGFLVQRLPAGLGPAHLAATLGHIVALTATGAARASTD